MKKSFIAIAVIWVFCSFAMTQSNAIVRSNTGTDTSLHLKHHEYFGLSPDAWDIAARNISAVSLLIWVYLGLARGGFWRVRMARSAAPPLFWPSVVAVVPARDEAEVIMESLSALLVQDYPGPFNVVLVDDHSTDGTAALAENAARDLGQADRLTVLAANELPPGWAGKVWAQSEGLAAVKIHFPDAQYFFLTDADIRHAPSTVRSLVARAQTEQRVLTSLMVRLRCESLAERMLIPAFVFFFAKLYPFSKVNDVHSKVAAAAGGCMLANADALGRIGGIAAIKDALIDDCALAAKMKQQGSIRLDLAEDSYSLRRYDDWTSIWNMIVRSAFTQLRYSPLLLAGTVLGMALTYLAPPVLAIACGGRAAWLAVAAWLVMTTTYCPMLRYHRQPLWWAPLLPLTALFYLAATLASAWRYWRGRGGQWKGRAQAIPKR
jgi:hopene-associated glycosyltransferase HpnB